VQFSATGEYVVTASDDRTAAVWKTGSWRKIATITGHASEVMEAQFSPDGRTRVLTVARDGTAAVSDALTGRRLFALGAADLMLTTATFSPNGRLIAAADSARKVRIWNADTGRELAPALAGHTGDIIQINFSADSSRVVTTSADNTSRVWDAVTGRELKVLRGHLRVVNVGQFTPDGKAVMTASNDGTARVWDVASGTNLLTLRSESDVLLMAALSPIAGRIVTASLRTQRASPPVPEADEDPSGDNVVEVFNTSTGALVSSFPQNEPIQHASFSADGRLVVTANRKTATTSGTARILSFDTSGQTATLRPLKLLDPHGDSVLSATFSHDGKLIATGSEDKVARIWKANGERLFDLRGLATPVSSPVTAVAFSRDDKYLITFGGDDQFPRLWAVDTGLLAFKPTGHTGPITYADFSPDGRQVVTASKDRKAIVWSTGSGQQLVSLGGRQEDAHDGTVYQARFSPNGKYVVTASADNTARVWDAHSGRLRNVLRGHRNEVNSATFSPDGQWILTASGDKTAQIWEAETGARVFTFRGHQGAVTVGEFSTDGQRVLTGGSDNSAVIFSCGLCKPIAELVNVAESRSRPLTTDEKEIYLYEPRAQAVTKVAGGR
jgi:WD40 repeat protein